MSRLSPDTLVNIATNKEPRELVQYLKENYKNI
jgi:hypothetical protein